MKEIRENKPGGGLYLDSPLEVLWTEDEFRKCTYAELAEFWCNWELAIDVSDRRVIRLYCREGNTEPIIKFLKVNSKTVCFEELEMDRITILHNKKNRKLINKYFGYAALKPTIALSESIAKSLFGEKGETVQKTWLEKKSYIDIDEYFDNYWNEDSLKHKYYRVISQLKRIVNLEDTSIKKASIDPEKKNFTDYKRCKYYQSEEYKFVCKIYTYKHKGDDLINFMPCGYDKSEEPKGFKTEHGTIARPGRIVSFLNDYDVSQEEYDMFKLKRISFLKFAFYFFKYSFHINEE